jgi:peptide/nickel transport system substrate-binding protein
MKHSIPNKSQSEGMLGTVCDDSALPPSRRSFITQSVLAAGIAGGILPVISFDSLAQTSSRPKRGGRLRIGCGDSSTTDSLHPYAAGNASIHLLKGQVFNSLTEIQPDNTVGPSIAESWDVEPGAKIWNFKIRKGVEFHNGKTVTPEDVIASLDFHRAPDSKSVARLLARQIDEMKIDGDYVKFTLHNGNADFPYVLADSHLAVLPAGKTDFEKVVGTGGYSLVEFQPGVRALAKRHSNYFRSGQAAWFDEVETISINDLNARLNALLSGQVDVINRLDPKLVDRIKGSSALQVVTVSGDLHYVLAMKADASPFDNNDLRLACKYALDREQIVKQLLRGYGSVGNDHPISRRNAYFAKDLPQREYDPDKAKFHLNKAGFDNVKIPFTIAPNVFSGALDLVQLYQQSAAKVGINMDIERVSDDSFWGSIWKKKTWTAAYWSGRPTPDGIFSVAWASSAPSNDSLWKNEQFDKILIEARTEIDQQKRRQLYYELQRIANVDGGTAVPVFADHIMAATSKLAYGKVGGDREFDGAKIATRWWFA